MAEKKGFFEDYEGNVLKVRDEDALPLSGGTLTGPVVGADGALDTAQLRNIRFGTEALVPGQSPLAPGTLYITPEGELDEISPQELLDKLKTVDGAGSGLDADMLGGTAASNYVKTTDIIGVGAPKAVRNSEALGGFLPSHYLTITEYGGTFLIDSKTPVVAAYNVSNSSRTRIIDGGKVVESSSYSEGLKLSIVSSLPSSKASDTIYFVKE